MNDLQRTTRRTGISRRTAVKGGLATMLMGAATPFAAAQTKGTPVPELLMIGWTPGADAIRFEIGELFVNDMRQYLGVEVRHLPLESEAKPPYYRADTKYAFSFTLTGLAARPWRVDPDEILSPLHSRNIRDGGGNEWAYSNPEFDKLVDAQASELDPARRRELVLEAQRVLYDDVGVLNLYSIRVIGLHNKARFSGFVPMYGTGAFNFWNAMEMKPLTNDRDMRVANVGDPGTLNVVSSSLGELEILQQIFDTIVRIRPDGSTVNWMAASIDNPTPSSFRVTLRDDLFFHDGKPLTAEDVAFTFRYYKQYGQPRLNPYLRSITAVIAESERVVRFDLASPSASFLTVVLGQSFILPKHVWEKVTDPQTRGVLENPQLMIGSGPFVFSSWRRGQDIYAKTFDKYFKPPAISGVRHIAYANNDAAFVAMRSGTADITGRPVLPDQAKEAEAFPFLQISRPDDISSRYVAFNHRRAPMNDVAFRRAVAHIFRYDYIVDTLLAGEGSLWSTSLITPGNRYYVNDKLKQFTFDPKLAKSILADADYTWDSSGRLLFR
jgi:peptide/nickel transport system substrate-binding protein